MTLYHGALGDILAAMNNKDVFDLGFQNQTGTGSWSAKKKKIYVKRLFKIQRSFLLYGTLILA